MFNVHNSRSKLLKRRSPIFIIIYSFDVPENEKKSQEKIFFVIHRYFHHKTKPSEVRQIGDIQRTGMT